jgi:hypothetical protein
MCPFRQCTVGKCNGKLFAKQWLPLGYRDGERCRSGTASVPVTVLSGSRAAKLCRTSSSMNAVAAPEHAIALPAGTHVFERGWLSSNNVSFADGDDTALVDSRYQTQGEQTVALFEQRLVDRPQRRRVNTHLHSNRCDGNAALQHRRRPLTSTPADDAEFDLRSARRVIRIHFDKALSHCGGVSGR